MPLDITADSFTRSGATCHAFSSLDLPRGYNITVDPCQRSSSTHSNFARFPTPAGRVSFQGSHGFHYAWFQYTFAFP
ncbi:hypothetical protein TSUD_133980 [Trifolium subterraneum]|uniref:Uncharacterized protein n=1 Tax=Trifolium subterraneum TaxID=3900 RepID=A0A2Z6NF87_TRISU|nr:hypothetical protein TSUD_133980 [Trifolium subterraneum]